MFDSGYSPDWSDVEYHYPAKGILGIQYDDIEDPELVQELETALRWANDSAEENAYYDAQDSALQYVLDTWAENISMITDDPEAIKHAIFEAGSEVITIDGSDTALALATMEIINGEGMFRYESIQEMQDAGPDETPEASVKDHLHYLLNVKLINDIYGVGNSHVLDVDTRYTSTCVDDDYLLDLMTDAVQEHLNRKQSKLKKFIKNHVPILYRS